MSKEYSAYISKVVNNIGVNGRKAKKIREDLYAALMEKHQITGEDDPYTMLGDPEEVAEEFRDNLGIKENRFNRYKYNYYEYKSNATIFGIPILHINYKPFGVAKGIISIENIAIGGVAISGFASMGGGAIAKYIAFGGYANGEIAIGGVTKGIISVYQQSGTGEFLFKAPVNVDEIMKLVRELYPTFWKPLLNIIENVIKLI